MTNSTIGWRVNTFNTWELTFWTNVRVVRVISSSWTGTIWHNSVFWTRITGIRIRTVWTFPWTWLTDFIYIFIITIDTWT